MKKKSRWGTHKERGVYKEPACPKKRIVRGCPNPKDLSLQDIFLPPISLILGLGDTSEKYEMAISRP